LTLNDLEWLFHDKICVFGQQILESERLNVRNITTSTILRCSVHCTMSSYPAYSRHAQLTRCFSAVAKLLLTITEIALFAANNIIVVLKFVRGGTYNKTEPLSTEISRSLGHYWSPFGDVIP